VNWFFRVLAVKAGGKGAGLARRKLPVWFAAGEYQIQTFGIGEEKWRISRSWKSKL
jgi:hypothetical protein